MTHAPDLPAYRKHAADDLDAAAVIEERRGLSSNIVIDSVSPTAIIRDPNDGTILESGPTVTNIEKNAGVYTHPVTGKTYAAGRVITYQISAGTAGETYWVDFAFTPTSVGRAVIIRQPVIVD